MIRLDRTIQCLLLCLVLAGVVALPSSPARADATVPPVWDIVSENFESGGLDPWQTVSPGDLSLVSGGGRNGSGGLSVVAGQGESYIYQANVARAGEGYLTFWFNPNNVSLPDGGASWLPDRSIRVATIKGGVNWHVLVALQVYRAGGQGYRAYLEWRAENGSQYDFASGQFDLANGWQKITIGYRVDDFVAVWLNDVQMRQVSGVSHQESLGEIIEIGKTNTTPAMNPSGALRYDDVAFQVPGVDDLWVDAGGGSDTNDGLTAASPFRTIQKAAELAGPGTTVHIQPGVYREAVRPALSGDSAGPALYLAEAGPGTAVLRGSEPASSLAWTQLAANTIGLPPGVDPGSIYYADLSAWGLDGPPRFVVELDNGGEVAARLPLAREPDWPVATEWKYHEFWWAADGGWDAAGCNPPTDPDPLDCDLAWRSTTQLTDRSNDSDPAGIEPGNLTTLGDLTGATLVALDTVQGHYTYRRTIVAHDVAAGRVTLDQAAEYDGSTPGLGWGSKYYVEGRPYLLDTPGEWWYDPGSRRLYLWPTAAGNPAAQNIEISRRDNGFNLQNRSYITLDGLTVELFNDSAVYHGNNDDEKSTGNTVRNALLRYANWGVWLLQAVAGGSPAANITAGFTLEDSEIAYMDTQAVRLSSWWENNAAADSFPRSGVVNTVIRGNELHHLGFRADGDNALGAVFHFADKLRFEDNHVHHVAQNGVMLSLSVIQSSKTSGFTPAEIKTGEILIKDNIFEQACQLNADCGGLKVWGDPPDNHVFRDTLITGNVFRNTFGWTYVSDKRGRWTSGSVRGMGGFGLYLNMASGVHVYRNIAYNNAYNGFNLYGAWRDGDVYYYNNLAANSLRGFSLGGIGANTQGQATTELVNNIIINNEEYGLALFDAVDLYSDITIDHNLYFGNGWGSGLWLPGAMASFRTSALNDYYQTLAEVQANTAWEDNGQAGDPAFWTYTLADHNPTDGSWPDFHLTSASASAIDRGATSLPASLTALLAAFDVDDPQWGSAFDIGRYEGGFTLLASPAAQAVEPGGVARYALSLHPVDLPHTVNLSAASPSPDLALSLSSSLLAPGQVVTLTVTDGHAEPLPALGLWYTIPLTGDGGGFNRPAEVRLLVGGARAYLPLISRE
ncbi:MAG: right-handed parallel beta-helix repeat-containing protein [Anaerolineae bacterium]